jgi:rhodanese-related sulfurtransferase
MVAEMDPETLHERLSTGEDVQVIDIRSARAFREGHIPGAENLPFPQLPQQVEAVDWDEEVVVACPKGKSSKQAARLIESYEGLPEAATVANLTDGYSAWEWELAAADDETAEDSEVDEGPDAPF